MNVIFFIVLSFEIDISLQSVSSGTANLKETASIKALNISGADKQNVIIQYGGSIKWIAVLIADVSRQDAVAQNDQDCKHIFFSVISCSIQSPSTTPVHERRHSHC
jgi:hypothetical protein